MLQTWVMLSPYKLYCHYGQHDNDWIDQLNVGILKYAYKFSIHLYNFLSDNKVEISTTQKILHTQAPYFGIGGQGKDLP
jgi:hypothetical protein